jgi:cell wall-associated NlpC family hydrolase
MSWTNDYIGLPYRLHGRDREGLDCWGMVREVYRDRLDVELPSLAEQYENQIDAEGFANAMVLESPAWEAVTTPQELDVVWCRIAGMECHTGIVLHGGRMLHAMQGNDSHIVDLNSMAWNRRVQACYRLR